MTAPTLTTSDETLPRRIADDLAAVREQWGDLLAAINRPPAAEWPPRDSRAHIDGHLADQADDEPSVGRMPLTLREHPAPVNLAALDAALEVEQALFALADQIAEYVQRAVRRRVTEQRSSRMGLSRIVAAIDRADAADPARWHYQSLTAPGSRAYGLHWAAVWCEGRVMGEDTGDLFAHVPARLLDQAATVARHARATVERALARDGRTTDLDRPCPWCAGPLVARTQSGGEPSVACTRGEACTAPAALDRGRRTWRGADLVALFTALGAADRRANEQETPHGAAA
ncbi:hypothetical protein [Streptomyces chryseus]